MKIPYVIGQEYHRRTDLHEAFGGSRQSGMSASAQHPVIFLFTGPGGAQYGYADHFAEDGLYWYTGEGQIGDMAFTKGNKALRDHIKDNRHALVFEQTRKGFCRFVGEVLCIGYHQETRPDRDGKLRDAIIFELAFDRLGPNALHDIRKHETAEPIELPGKLAISELRKLAITGSNHKIEPRTVKARVHYRSEAIRRYAILRSNGICEACKNPAPFTNKQGAPYLEVHHLTRLADGGPDAPDRVAAICANCHRRAHHSLDANEFNLKLTSTIRSIEKENM